MDKVAIDGGPDRLDRVEVDFARVDRIASDGLSGLMSFNRSVKQRGGQLIIRNASESLKELFHITRVDRVIAICYGPHH